MDGRRSRLDAERSLNPTQQAIEVLFNIGHAAICGVKYEFDPEFDCSGIDQIELHRMVISRELSFPKFKIVLKGYEALIAYREKTALRHYGKILLMLLNTIASDVREKQSILEFGVIFIAGVLCELNDLQSANYDCLT